MKRIGATLFALVVPLAGGAWAGSQDRFELPQPYLGWERQYLQDFPELRRVLDVMVETSARQLEDPSQDILHNRVCSALAHRMALEMGLAPAERRLAIAADLLHNISKEERALVLTDPPMRRRASAMVAQLRRAGHFAQSPAFWSEESLFDHPKIGANLALIHHVTGAVSAAEILERLGGYPAADIARVQAAIAAHSTGYWYFRRSIDEIAGQRGAWRKVFPEPGDAIARIAHDADLISQFEAESVVPAGSKWRVLAATRWGAQGAVEEAHVVYYVFSRLYDEARTEPGKALARAEWRKIAPELVKLMRLAPGSDPIQALGVPRAFR